MNDAAAFENSFNPYDSHTGSFLRAQNSPITFTSQVSSMLKRRGLDLEFITCFVTSLKILMYTQHNRRPIILQTCDVNEVESYCLKECTSLWLIRWICKGSIIVTKSLLCIYHLFSCQWIGWLSLSDQGLPLQVQSLHQPY